MTLIITYPSLRVGFGTSVKVRMGGESGDGLVSWRAFIVSSILKDNRWIIGINRI